MVKIFGYVFLGIIAFAGFAALSLLIAFPVMWLWNWLMPELFGFKTIGFWQAAGLYFLASILFKSSVSSSSSKS